MQRHYTQTFGVVAALIEHDGQYLLMREDQHGRPEDGQWNHPAGWIEVGEDPHEAVKREVKEETGYDFTPTAVLGIYSLVKYEIADAVGHPPHPIKIVYTGDISDEQTAELQTDSREIAWFTPQEVEEMPLDTLRDGDIPQMISDHRDGIAYPLSVVRHATTGSA